jgi:taurine dioxygenase
MPGAATSRTHRQPGAGDAGCRASGRRSPPGDGPQGALCQPGLTLRFEGWTDEESRPLLDYLSRHAVRPEFTIRCHWREGSLAFWDNRSTSHFAVNDYHGQRRLLHRLTIEAVPLSS